MFIVLIQLETANESNKKYEGVIFPNVEQVVKWADANRNEEFRVFNSSEFEVIKSVRLKPIPATRGV